MQEKNFLTSLISIVGMIFFALVFALILLEDTVFSLIQEYTGESAIQESKQATEQTAKLLLSLEKITFDTKVLSLPYVQGLTTFPSFSVDSETLSNFGKNNPFNGNSVVVVEQASSTVVGGIIYSGQRSLNNNNSIRAVNTR